MPYTGAEIPPAGALRGSTERRWQLLCDDTRWDYANVRPYSGAEIPPAGAPSGFDYAAMIGFIA